MITLFETSITSNQQYVYHIIQNYSKNTISKHGLCSPFKLYNTDLNLFKKYSYNIYKERTASFLNKRISKITNEDILFYLDNKQRYPLTSQSIFFSLIPFSDLPSKTQDQIGDHLELKINIRHLLKYNPILINGKSVSYTSWDEILNPLFILNLKKKIKHSDHLIYKHIPHICVNCNYISSQILKRDNL